MITKHLQGHQRPHMFQRKYWQCSSDEAWLDRIIWWRLVSISSYAMYTSSKDSLFGGEPSPLHTSTIVEKCTLKLVDEYRHMLSQATEPLSTFLEYITYGHMIDNVVLIVIGTLHERDIHELLENCHPLGMLDSIATLQLHKICENCTDWCLFIRLWLHTF